MHNLAEVKAAGYLKGFLSLGGAVEGSGVLQTSGQSVGVACGEIEGEGTHNLLAGGQVAADNGKTMRHGLDENESETFPAGAENIDLRLGVVVLDIVGKGMQVDAVLQMIVGNHLSIQGFFRAFAHDVERPFAIVLCKQMEGLYQQVEALC